MSQRNNMALPLYFNPELDHPRSFKSLGDFTKAVADAIAADDQALTDHLLVNFRVSDDGVLWIGHGNDTTTLKELL